MFQLLKLLLPALIPSWRFFKEIGPSPRVQYRVQNRGVTSVWREALMRPDHVTWPQMLQRMVWNPSWNSYLFSVSCAERLISYNCEKSLSEINARVAQSIHDPDTGILQIRLVFVERAGRQLQHAVVFESDPVSLAQCR